MNFPKVEKRLSFQPIFWSILNDFSKGFKPNPSLYSGIRANADQTTAAYHYNLVPNNHPMQTRSHVASHLGRSTQFRKSF